MSFYFCDGWGGIWLNVEVIVFIFCILVMFLFFLFFVKGWFFGNGCRLGVSGGNGVMGLLNGVFMMGVSIIVGDEDFLFCRGDSCFCSDGEWGV